MTWRAAALGLLLPACGGHFEATSHAAPGDVGGNAGASELGPQSEPAVAGAADAGDDLGGSGAGGGRGGAAGDGSESAAGEAGARSAPRPSIASGTRYCENDLYCFGLSCYAPFNLEQQVCIDEDCRTDDDCHPGEQCLSSTHLAVGCYATCQTPFDCNYGFDCFDFTNQHQSLVCFPTPWAAVWAAKGP